MENRLLHLGLLGALSFILLGAQACSRTSDSSGGGRAASPFRTASNELVWNNGAEPESLDPHRISAHDAAQLSMQLFEGLLSRGQNYLELRPGLASDWSVSEDGKTYSFTLREGLKWSNGEAITIDQVYRSFLRALNPNVPNSYVAWYTDFIKGAKELYENYDLQSEERLKNLGIRVSGNQIHFELIKPVAYFKYLISQPPFFVIHPNLFDPDTSSWKEPGQLIGSAAYRLKEWRVNDRIVMEKNPHYYEADQVTFERLVALPINDQAASLNLYETGRVDWSGENTIAPNKVSAFMARDDFHHMPILGTYTYIFNMRKKPFDDLRIRKAFALAINQDDVVNRVLRAGYVATHRIVPPVFEGYESLIPEPQPFEERVKEAQKLLEEAGHPRGEGLPPITLKYNTNESHHRIAQAVQQMWRQHLGVQVGLENMEWKVYLADQDAGNYQVSRFAWIGDYPDPSTFLELFMTGNANNRTRWSNSEYDKILEEAASILDDRQRYQRLAQAEKIMAADYPMIGLYNYAYYSLMNPAVQGFEPNIHGHYLFRFFSKKAVDSSARLN